MSDQSFRQELGARILACAGHFPTKTAASEAAGVSVEQLNKWIAGTVKVPIEGLYSMARAADIDFNWLASGVGSGSQGGTVSSFPTASHISGMVAVPLLDVRPSAGAGALVEQLGDGREPEIVAFREDWLRRIGVGPRHARLMVCRGDSMHDTISDGDLMIVDISIRDVVDSGIYVLVYAGLVIVKRVQILRDRSLVLKSDNPRYEPEVVPAHEQPELIVEGRVRWAGGQI